MVLLHLHQVLSHRKKAKKQSFFGQNHEKVLFWKSHYGQESRNSVVFQNKTFSLTMSLFKEKVLFWKTIDLRLFWPV